MQHKPARHVPVLVQRAKGDGVRAGLAVDRAAAARFLARPNLMLGAETGDGIAGRLV